jgi:hypothetical protein
MDFLILIKVSIIRVHPEPDLLSDSSGSGKKVRLSTLLKMGRGRVEEDTRGRPGSP